MMYHTECTTVPSKEERRVHKKKDRIDAETKMKIVSHPREISLVDS